MVYKAFAVDKVLLCSASVRHNAAKYYLEGRGEGSLSRLLGKKLQLFFSSSAPKRFPFEQIKSGPGGEGGLPIMKVNCFFRSGWAVLQGLVNNRPWWWLARGWVGNCLSGQWQLSRGLEWTGSPHIAIFVSMSLDMIKSILEDYEATSGSEYWAVAGSSPK